MSQPIKDKVEYIQEYLFIYLFFYSNQKWNIV